MNHYRIALLLDPLHELPYPARRHAHLLGALALSHAAGLYPLQPVQAVPFRLAHRDSFHPSTLRLSRGSFYLAQRGTFCLAATVAEIHMSLRSTRCDAADGDKLYSHTQRRVSHANRQTPAYAHRVGSPT